MNDPPDSPRSEAMRWLSYAEEDLTGAHALLNSDSPGRLACFHAQQAAEKALKAILVKDQIPAPKTHNLLTIRALLTTKIEISVSNEDLAELSAWAVEARYPGDLPVATPKEAHGAVAVAEQIVQAVSGYLMRTLNE